MRVLSSLVADERNNEMTTIHYCKVHRSVADNDRENCHWDLMAGPRPGRGPCQIREMEIRDLPDNREPSQDDSRPTT